MSEQNLLQVSDLSVSVDEMQILHKLNLSVNPGETHVLMGPNGAGKSTLGNTLMGNPSYVVDEGKIFFDGQDITGLSTDKRAAAGMFMSFQNPLEVPGISLSAFLLFFLGAKRRAGTVLPHRRAERTSCRRNGRPGDGSPRNRRPGRSGGIRLRRGGFRGNDLRESELPLPRPGG